MASLVVGLLGLKRSGKDTFAARLVEAHGFTRIAFADPLKEAALALDPIVRIEARESLVIGNPLHASARHQRLSALVSASGWEAAKSVADVRRTLQNLGVAVRAIEEDFWLDAAIDRVYDTDGPVVITDVRFPNEAGYIARHGVTVRVVRPGQTHTDPHVSETALADAPTSFSVVNDSTIEALHAKADELAALVG